MFLLTRIHSRYQCIGCCRLTRLRFVGTSHIVTSPPCPYSIPLFQFLLSGASTPAHSLILRVTLCCSDRLLYPLWTISQDFLPSKIDYTTASSTPIHPRTHHPSQSSIFSCIAFSCFVFCFWVYPCCMYAYSFSLTHGHLSSLSLYTGRLHPHARCD